MAYREKIQEVIKELVTCSSDRFAVNPVNKIEISKNGFCDSILIRSNSVVFDMIHTYIDNMGALDTVNFKIDITVWGKVRILHSNIVSDRVISQFIDSFNSSYINWFNKEKLADNSVKRLIRTIKNNIQDGIKV